ncbi:phosphatase PAP2 family protein [Taibaiella koreensis]|uniref:phosphatase PAP2 family protein n=1 Tax=Taibaiella koreensis TaxID=1268548 RepID=UPI0013C2ACE4|nr:phosphatase PAP2 family protein [Taibaiella koreensis]
MILLTCSVCVRAQPADSMVAPPATRFSMQQLTVPAALITTGVLSVTVLENATSNKIASWRSRQWDGFHTRVDDYLQYAPIPLAYGLDLIGIPSRNDVWNRSLILVKGELLMLASVNLIKYTTREQRPDGSNNHSFPSGHTAQAFAAATFLSEEYKARLPWIPYAAYGMAAATGVLRIANNKHYLGDVLTGAGLGILSMKVSYWTHRYLWGKHKRRRPVRNLQP